MGILVECPNCKIRYSLNRRVCKCGNKVQKAGSKNYWIEYYLKGKRTRERIGRSKLEPENEKRKKEFQNLDCNYNKIKGSLDKIQMDQEILIHGSRSLDPLDRGQKISIHASIKCIEKS